MPYLRRKVHDSPVSLERMFVRTHVRPSAPCPLAPASGVMSSASTSAPLPFGVMSSCSER